MKHNNKMFIFQCHFGKQQVIKWQNDKALWIRALSFYIFRRNLRIPLIRKIPVKRKRIWNIYREGNKKNGEVSRHFFC